MARFRIGVRSAAPPGPPRQEVSVLEAEPAMTASVPSTTLAPATEIEASRESQHVGQLRRQSRHDKPAGPRDLSRKDTTIEPAAMGSDFPSAGRGDQMAMARRAGTQQVHPPSQDKNR